METRRNKALWAVSLIVIGVTSLVLFGTKLAGTAMPDAAVRVLGILDLAALPVLGFTTVRKIRER